MPVSVHETMFPTTRLSTEIRVRCPGQVDAGHVEQAPLRPGRTLEGPSCGYYDCYAFGIVRSELPLVTMRNVMRPGPVGEASRGGCFDHDRRSCGGRGRPGSDRRKPRSPRRRRAARGHRLRPRRRSTWAASDYLKTGEVLPEPRSASSRRATPSCSVPSAHPGVPPGVLEKGILLRLRFDFHQYVNLRPIQLFPGVEGPIRGKGPDDVDMVVVRENNEDLYVGAGGFPRKGTPEEVAIQTSINTRAGVERPLRFAFELARRAPRPARSAACPPADRRARPVAAGDPGRQDQRADLRPRPLDARLHRSRARLSRTSSATISTWTPAACGWWPAPSGST